MKTILLLTLVWACLLGYAGWLAWHRRARPVGRATCPRCGRRLCRHGIQAGLFYKYQRETCACGYSKLIVL